MKYYSTRGGVLRHKQSRNLNNFFLLIRRKIRNLTIAKIFFFITLTIANYLGGRIFLRRRWKRLVSQDPFYEIKLLFRGAPPKKFENHWYKQLSHVTLFPSYRHFCILKIHVTNRAIAESSRKSSLKENAPSDHFEFQYKLLSIFSLTF